MVRDTASSWRRTAGPVLEETFNEDELRQVAWPTRRRPEIPEVDARSCRPR